MRNFALERFQEYVAAYQADPALVWDLETEGLDPGSRSLCVSWTSYRQTRPECAPGNLLEVGGFAGELERAAVVVAHNAKFEIQALIKRGVDARRHVWWCTQVAEWVLLANNHSRKPLNLDDTAVRYGSTPKDPYVDAMIRDGQSANVPLSWLMERNTKDVADTRLIFQAQRAKMTPKQIALTAVRCMFMVELAYLELNGMKLDAEEVRREFEENAAKIIAAEEAIYQFTAGANTKSVNEMAPILYGIWPTTVQEDKRVLPPGIECLGFEEPKLTSGPMKGQPDRLKATKAWPNGRPRLDVETIDGLARSAKTDKQRAWAALHLELADLYAERDKNLNYFMEVCQKHDGIVFAELMQGVAATHRLTCRGKPRPGDAYGCQLQNVPRKYKGCFIAKTPGHLFTNVDQTAAEFNGAGFLSQDPQILADIRDPGFDAHIQSAHVMKNRGKYDAEKYRELFARKKEPKVKAMRQDAKPNTFKPLYGGQSGTDAERSYYKWFAERYKVLTEVQDKWVDTVNATGRLELPTGLVAEWPRSVNEKGRVVSAISGRSLYTIVRNFPIQYFATGELAMLSTLCLCYDARAARLRWEPVMLVHDATQGEVHPDDADAYHEICGEAYGAHTWEFLFEAYGIRYNVKLAAESQAGVRCGEGRESVHTYVKE